MDDAASGKKQHRRSKRQQEAMLRAQLKETMPSLFVPRRKPRVTWLDEHSRRRVSSYPPPAQQTRKKASAASRRRKVGRDTPPRMTAAALMMPVSTVPPPATAAPEKPVEPQREAAEEAQDDPFLSLRFLSDAASWSPRHVAPLVSEDVASGNSLGGSGDSLMTDSSPYEEDSPSGPSERRACASAAVACDPDPCSWASTYLHALKCVPPCEKGAEVYEPLGGRYDIC